MKNNVLNIVFIVIDGIELVLGTAFGSALLLIGYVMLIFSGLDGSQDERLPSAVMLLSLVAVIATAIASLVLSIMCISARSRSRKKWIASIAVSASNIIFLLIFFIALHLTLW